MAGTNVYPVKFKPDSSFSLGGGNIQFSDIYNEYSLRVFYPLNVDVTTQQIDPNDNTTTAKTFMQQVFYSQNFALQGDGEVSFSLQDLEDSHPVYLRLQAPDGGEIWELDTNFKDLNVLKTQQTPIIWETNPLSYPIIINNPHVQNEMLRLRGKAVDLTGEQKVANQQVIIWGKYIGSTIWQAVMITTTDAEGNFFGDYPLGKFEEGAATVSGTNAATEANALPISLEIHPLDSNAMAFPKFVFLVLDEVNTEDDSCDCNGVKVPRCPDASDLHDNANVYSQDIGGSCTNFTVPNRSLEEFTYYMVVRTTEPRIKGMTLSGFEKYASPPGKTIFDPPIKDNGTTTVDNPQAEPTPQDPTTTAKTASTTNENEIQLGGITIGNTNNTIPIPLGDLNKGGVSLSNFNLNRTLSGDFLSFFSGRVPMDEDNVPEWDSEPKVYQAVTIAHGHLLQYRQTWKADGYSLGDLLYSLPLAPGQKKQIAIFDWDRSEAARREERFDYSESLTAYLSHDRDVNEISNAVLHETIRGKSYAFNGGMGGGAGLGASAPIQGILLGVSSGFSSGSGFALSGASQKSSRDISANTLQKLRDSVMQAASAVRSQRTSVIQTVNQSERFSVETEVIANHNHCHAVTMEYFEILRHFCVEQKLVSVQECLFVPLQMDMFDEKKALRWREILKNTIAHRFGFDKRRNEFLRAFDALERAQLENEANANTPSISLYPSGNYADQNIVEITGEMEISFILNRPADTTTTTNNATSYNFDGTLWQTLSNLIGYSTQAIQNKFSSLTQVQRDALFEKEYAPKAAYKFIEELEIYGVTEDLTTFALLSPTVSLLDITLLSKYKREVRLKVGIRTGHSTTNFPSRKSFNRLYIKTPYDLSAGDEFSRATMHSIQLNYRTKYSSGVLCQDTNVKNDIRVGDGVTIFCPLRNDELVNPKSEDKILTSKLLKHLNANMEQYHQTIWYNMDAERRYMILDGYLAPNAKGRSVASVIENRLIGIVGNSLVFPVAPGFKLDPTYVIPTDKDGNATATLFDHYLPLTPSPAYRVSVPTRGVFAEAVQGACNSCEKIDDSRFWKWEEHPIDEPTAINPINTPTPVVNNPNLTASPLANPLVSIQNAPAAPDPQDYAALLQTLGNPDLFKDLTGLNQTQLNALQSMLSAQNNAQKYAQTAAKLSALAAQMKAYDDLAKEVDEDDTLSPQEKKAKKDAYRQGKEQAAAQMSLPEGTEDGFDHFMNSIDNQLQSIGKAGLSNYDIEAKDKYGNSIKVNSEGGINNPLDKPRNVYVIEDGWNGGLPVEWNGTTIGNTPSALTQSYFGWVQAVVNARPGLFGDVNKYLNQSYQNQNFNHHVIYVFSANIVHPRTLPDADMYNLTPQNGLFSPDMNLIQSTYGNLLDAQAIADFQDLQNRPLPISAVNNRNYSFVILPNTYVISPIGTIIFPPNEMAMAFVNVPAPTPTSPTPVRRMQIYAMIHELLAHVNYRKSIGLTSPSGIVSLGNPNHTQSNNAWEKTTGYLEQQLIATINTI